MTLAVCLVCGTHKRGPLLPCPACDWAPVDDEDRARSVLMTEHHHEPAELDRLAEALAGGADVVVPELLLAQELGCEGKRQARDAEAEPEPPRASAGTAAGEAQAAAIASLGELVGLAHSRHRYIHAGRHGVPLVDEVVRRALDRALALGDAPHPTHAAWLARLLCLPFAPHVAIAALEVLGRGDDGADPGRAADRLAALPPPWPGRALATIEHLVEVAVGPPYPREVLAALADRLAGPATAG
ncbi:MAG: hypothetical protein M9894_26135 [Planctomycetes bacterium]|nr:hypothetical protein [Planctomycetota bacterium]